jgi:hypothetical protein
MDAVLRLQVQDDPEIENDAPISSASFDHCHVQ